MARRLTTRQAENVGKAIQTAKLVRALQDYALGKRTMEPGQVQAIRILLAKTLPDQKAIDHTVSGSVEWRLKLT